MSEASVAARLYRFYLAVDVSYSMRRPRGALGSMTPAEKLSLILPELCLKLGRMPTIATRAWLSIICFADKAEVLMPASSLRDRLVFPRLPEGVETNYEAAIEAIDRQEEADIRNLTLPLGKVWFEPVIFFLTDGEPIVNRTYQPENVWMSARSALVARSKARIVTLGFGDAKEDTLWKLATDYAGNRMAFIDDHCDSPSDLLDAIKIAITRSISRSIEQGEFYFDLPDGMRWARPLDG